MERQVAKRGSELADAGRVIAARPGVLARLFAGRADALLARIDAGLARGVLSLTLPDGSRRQLGGRAPGFSAEVRLIGWNALFRLATAGSVGCYQGWEAGEWDSADPVSLFALFVDNSATLGDAARAHGPWRWAAKALHWLHRNTRSGSARNIHAHYDLGNDFYAAWLDPSMTYSSARFTPGATTLEAAQRAKVAAIVERLGPAHSVLEIGCGWGTLAAAMADAGMDVTAISLSDRQLEWARRQHAGRAIEFRHQDYRDVSGEFDAIASVEMVEAVGRAYWPAFLDCLARCLKPGGRAAIQYILIRDDLFAAYAADADFIQTYVFPGGMLISEGEFRRLAEERGLEWTAREGFGMDYAETLRLWREAFDRAHAEGRLPAGFDERFVRLWRFYLMYCEGGFRGGAIDVAQITLIRR